MRFVHAVFDEGDEEARCDNTDRVRFWRRFEDNAGTPRPPEPTATIQQEVKVTVTGLDRVRIDGLEPQAAAKAQAHLEAFGRVISAPESYEGIG